MNRLDIVTLVPLLALLLFLGQAPEEVNGIRMEAKSAQHTGTSSFLQQRHGNHEAKGKEVATTATATVTVPNMAGLLQRMTAIQGKVKTLDAKVTSLEQDASKVEAQMSMTGVNLAISMGSLAKIKADSSANQKVAIRLANQSKLLQAKSLKTTTALNTLITQANNLETSAKMMGKGSTELGAKIASLEGAVSEQLPGVGTISKRLDKVGANVKSLEAELKKGIEAQVGAELKQMLNQVRGEVRGLADELDKREKK